MMKNTTKKLLAERKNAYLGGVYFELRIAYISLAASMEGKLYANGAIADRLPYLDDVERLDRLFSLMVDTYREPLTVPYFRNLLSLLTENALETEAEAKLISLFDLYEAEQAPTLSQISILHVMVGRLCEKTPAYAQIASLILIKECLRFGYVPPMIDAFDLPLYRRALKLFDLNHDACLHYIERAQARTRERAAFFHIAL